MTQTKRNHFRIIAGEWRSRRCQFAAREGLRPTPDRVRETLFNWLGRRVADARCLDLFAGSGALGLEALSRGAREAVFVERDPMAAHAITANVRTLGTGRAIIEQTSAQAYLQRHNAPFDIVFIDPPFNAGMLPQVLARVTPFVCSDGCIYVEFAGENGIPPLPNGWRVVKASHAGRVSFIIAACDG